MRYIKFLVILIAAVLLIPADIQAQDADKSEAEKAKSIATVTFNKGRNRIIKPDGAFQKCIIDAVLFEADKISVSSNGKVTIVYIKTGLFKTFNADEEVVISANDETKEQEIDASKVSQAMLENIHGNADKPILAAVAGTREHRDPNQPFPISPRNTLLLFTDKITFSWQNPDIAAKAGVTKTKYKLHIFNKGVEIQVIDCENNSFELDMKKYDLKFNELYYWFVERTDLPRVAPVKPMFIVTSSDVSAKIRGITDETSELTTDAEDGSPFLLNAKFLVQKLYYQLAVENFVQCYKLSPGDEGLIAGLKDAYKLMGFYAAEIDIFINQLKEKYPAQPE